MLYIEAQIMHIDSNVISTNISCRQQNSTINALPEQACATSLPQARAPAKIHFDFGLIETNKQKSPADHKCSLAVK
jgi:hypothetical protein